MREGFLIFPFCYEKKIAVQGNLDPVDLYVGGDYLEKKVMQIIKKFSGLKHIFNLSHGILPQTPIVNVQKTIKLIRDFNEAR